MSGKLLTLLKIIMPPLLLALLLAFCISPSGGRIRSALFYMGIGKKGEELQIRQVVRNYNAATQGSYATAGLAVDELSAMPAYPLEKRRIYKDLNLLRISGKMIVFDKDKETVESVRFLSRNRAVVNTEELWVLVLQDFATRRKLTNLKASQIRCRYHVLRYEGSWKVERVEVFPGNEPVPPMNIHPVL